jgi:hypothetical protein
MTPPKDATAEIERLHPPKGRPRVKGAAREPSGKKSRRKIAALAEQLNTPAARRRLQEIGDVQEIAAKWTSDLRRRLPHLRERVEFAQSERLDVSDLACLGIGGAVGAPHAGTLFGRLWQAGVLDNALRATGEALNELYCECYGSGYPSKAAGYDHLELGCHVDGGRQVGRRQRVADEDDGEQFIAGDDHREKDERYEPKRGGIAGDTLCKIKEQYEPDREVIEYYDPLGDDLDTQVKARQRLTTVYHLVAHTCGETGWQLLCAAVAGDTPPPPPYATLTRLVSALAMASAALDMPIDISRRDMRKAREEAKAERERIAQSGPVEFWKKLGSEPEIRSARIGPGPEPSESQVYNREARIRSAVFAPITT